MIAGLLETRPLSKAGYSKWRREVDPETMLPNNASFTLAVCAEMIFRDLPIVERVKRIAALGFQVEIWDWTRHDIVKALGYAGNIGLEAWASGDNELALRRFREAFTVPG